jgi:hypothetical protein
MEPKRRVESWVPAWQAPFRRCGPVRCRGLFHEASIGRSHASKQQHGRSQRRRFHALGGSSQSSGGCLPAVIRCLQHSGLAISLGQCSSRIQIPSCSRTCSCRAQLCPSHLRSDSVPMRPPIPSLLYGVQSTIRSPPRFTAGPSPMRRRPSDGQ